jgi:hypothetical protein
MGYGAPFIFLESSSRDAEMSALSSTVGTYLGRRTGGNVQVPFLSTFAQPMAISSC